MIQKQNHQNDRLEVKKAKTLINFKSTPSTASAVLLQSQPRKYESNENIHERRLDKKKCENTLGRLLFILYFI